MKKNGSIRTLLISLVLFVVFAALLFGVNVFAAPIIASNGSAAELAPLYSVMPDAKGFELIYDAADPAASALTEVPGTVRSVSRESSGLGYVLRLSTTEGYTHEPIELSLAVDGEGRISGAEVTVYPETKDMGVDSYPLTYIGKDSALADVGLVAGVTYSSSAFRGAVLDGFDALIANDLISEGVKSDAQLLEELLPVLFPGLANAAGVLQVEPAEAAGEVQKAMLSTTGGGFAAIVAEGESSYLVIVNASDLRRVYDVDGNDVTADKAALAGLVSPTLTDFGAADVKAIGRLLGDGAELTALPLEGVYNSVTGAYRVQDGDSTCYAFSARPFGYSNMPMTLWYVLDENGAIVVMNAEEWILVGEYFSNYELDEPSYRAGFAGLTADSFTGEQALISGATVSSDAVRTATDDVFAAFAALTDAGVIAPEEGGESLEG